MGPEITKTSEALALARSDLTQDEIVQGIVEGGFTDDQIGRWLDRQRVKISEDYATDMAERIEIARFARREVANG